MNFAMRVLALSPPSSSAMREAFEELGFELKKEFEAKDEEAATTIFIDWCNAETGEPCTVERVDLVGTLKKVLEDG